MLFRSRIEKTVKGGRTSTTVTAVNGIERETEIGRMMGGAEVSAAVLAGAREMIEAKANTKRKAKAKPAANHAADGPRITRRDAD